MERMKQINDILGKVRDMGYFQTIRRGRYNYDLSFAMQVVEALGKERNPNFVIDDENRFTYENFVRWIMGDPEMMCLDPETKQPVPGRLNAGIYIAGNTGSGKSWALEIMSVFCSIDNIQVAFGSDKKDIRCLRWNNVRTDTICEEFATEGSYQRYKQYQIVGIQDLGAEPVESLYMGNRIDVIRQILESRGDRTDRLTLITSNLPINHKKLIERYGDRVASRLTEMCNYFEIKGADRRKAQNNGRGATKTAGASKAPNK